MIGEHAVPGIERPNIVKQIGYDQITDLGILASRTCHTKHKPGNDPIAPGRNNCTRRESTSDEFTGSRVSHVK